jgi:hypothetical protein
MVEHLLTKHKALSLIPVPPKKKKKNHVGCYVDGPRQTLSQDWEDWETPVCSTSLPLRLSHTHSNQLQPQSYTPGLGSCTLCFAVLPNTGSPAILHSSIYRSVGIVI